MIPSAGLMIMRTERTTVAAKPAVTPDLTPMKPINPPTGRPETIASGSCGALP